MRPKIPDRFHALVYLLYCTEGLSRPNGLLYAAGMLFLLTPQHHRLRIISSKDPFPSG